MDVGIALAGLLVGIVVGLTGMGGGALMTPVLVLFFKVDALTAISSDVVSSLFMKPAGAIVHIVRKTANLTLVLWLCIGSVPSAFIGAMLVDHLRGLAGFEEILLVVLGVALLLASGGLIVRAWFQMTRKQTLWGEGAAPASSPEIEVRKVPTVLLGALGGLMVGLTSVGAGSLILTLLLVLYPRLKPSQLVGTDLVQAVPLVAAASIGHLMFGQVSLGITGSMLVGAIPGAFIGAQISSRAPGGVIRRALAILLMASGLKLVGVPTVGVLVLSGAATAFGPIAWAVLRRRYSWSSGTRSGRQGPRVDRKNRPLGPPAASGVDRKNRPLGPPPDSRVDRKNRPPGPPAASDLEWTEGTVPPVHPQPSSGSRHSPG